MRSGVEQASSEAIPCVAVNEVVISQRCVFSIFLATNSLA
jgi:hypothetical protein